MFTQAQYVSVFSPARVLTGSAAVVLICCVTAVCRGNKVKSSPDLDYTYFSKKKNPTTYPVIDAGRGNEGRSETGIGAVEAAIGTSCSACKDREDLLDLQNGLMLRHLKPASETGGQGESSRQDLQTWFIRTVRAVTVVIVHPIKWNGA